MLTLAVETATASVGCAVARDDEVLACEQVPSPRRHAELLTPMLDRVRRAAGVELAALDVVAVDVGPGLFTGLRVGLASALTLAHALAVPVVGVPSLDLLALAAEGPHAAGTGGPVRVVAAVDARRGEVFWASYRRASDAAPGAAAPFERTSEPAVGRPDELVQVLAVGGERVLLVGDGARRYADTLGACPFVTIAPARFDHPDVGVLAREAARRAARGEARPAVEIAPLYLRAPDIDRGWLDTQAAT